MTAQNDLDRALGAWFSGDATVVPPQELLARAIESTRMIRPRPALTASVGSRWVGAVSTDRSWDRLASLRPALIVALVAVLALALVATALLVGSRLVAPNTLPRVYLDEFASAPDLSMPMARPTLVALQDGRVLVIGDDGDGGATGTRALVYDPATGDSEPTEPLVSGESLGVDSAVRLKDGKVLVIGNGFAQIFDPGTKRFDAVGPMVMPRTYAATALLHDGRVLITGGTPVGQDAATNSAELFDPTTGKFSSTGSMTETRNRHAMATLPDDRVFVSPGDGRRSAEIYDPGTATFSPVGTMSREMRDNIAVPLSDGRVVVLGEVGLNRQSLLSVWDPVARTVTSEPTGPISAATLLDDGRILMIGASYGTWSATYDPTSGRMPVTHGTPSTWWPSVVRLADGRVLLVGGLIDGKVRPGASGGGESAPALPTVEVFR